MLVHPVVAAWQDLPQPVGDICVVEPFLGTQRYIGVSRADLKRNEKVLQPLFEHFSDRVPAPREVESLIAQWLPHRSGRHQQLWVTGQAQLLVVRLGNCNSLFCGLSDVRLSSCEFQLFDRHKLATSGN